MQKKVIRTADLYRTQRTIIVPGLITTSFSEVFEYPHWQLYYAEEYFIAELVVVLIRIPPYSIVSYKLTLLNPVT